MADNLKLSLFSKIDQQSVCQSIMPTMAITINITMVMEMDMEMVAMVKTTSRIMVLIKLL